MSFVIFKSLHNRCIFFFGPKHVWFRCFNLFFDWIAHIPLLYIYYFTIQIVEHSITKRPKIFNNIMIFFWTKIIELTNFLLNVNKNKFKLFQRNKKYILHFIIRMMSPRLCSINEYIFICQQYNISYIICWVLLEIWTIIWIKW